MIGRLMFGRWKKAQSRVPSGDPGWRAYAIGDVHGRLDLLDALLLKIEVDHLSLAGSAKGLLIFLGDLIDRGPNSREVVERVRGGPLAGFRTVALMGNHEEVLLRLLEGREPGLLPQWLRFGGAECLSSYGLDPASIAALPEREAIARIAAALPAEHVAFLHELGDTFRLGDYLFVHAGIRPGLRLEEQSTHDLRWIRRAFLDDPRDHGFVVVHGHTMSEEVEERSNRIGIDTGAYHFGTLTALAIEGGRRWFLQQSEAELTAAADTAA